MSLRKKIADSEAVQNWVARRIASYFRLVHRSSRWQRIGFETLDALVDDGEPVIVVLWHQRLTQSPYLFPLDKAPICTITSSARAGSMAGRVQQLFGMDTIAMSSHKRHVALSREVLGKIRQGISIGIAADGPRGPERVCSTVPLIWARTSGKRVFAVTYSARNAHEAGTWDRLFLPRPWTEGVILCREWTQSVPRKADADQIEALRLDLQALLNDLTAEADRMVGRTPNSGEG
ncbi:lysophospholipid acyltransferase family protein [Cribrihabitans marinus]|uniref:lysophospholipid acyltransferase family protein n=1 Tax=Cribrihabitans marinus TaxID=1227549 RepID=UPI000B89C4D3|nr:DUF374 domain-containing protein [Cribrihabitans marinus]